MIAVVKVTIIGLGILLLALTLFSLAKRRMQPTFSAIWGVLALLMIVLGVAMRLSQLPDFISWRVLIYMIAGGCLVLFSIYLITLQISELKSQVGELAMQVSLLSEENRALLERQQGNGDDSDGQ